MDWLSFTVPEDVFEDVPADSYRLFHDWLPGIVLGEESRQGRNWFQYTRVFFAIIGTEAVEVGFAAWGGNKNRHLVNIVLNGQGCAKVADWRRVAAWCESREARLSRVDVAVDFLDGEFTIDQAAACYLAGDFNFNNRPSHRQIGPWLDGDREGKGRTLEVGRRVNGKMCRIYEKGKQLGDPDSPWVRFEVELHNRDRVLPYELLRNPSGHFAGAYPLCKTLIELPPLRIPTWQAEWDTTLEAYTANLARAYGKGIGTLRKEFGDDGALLDALQVEGIPKRLRRPALYLVRNLDPELEEAKREDRDYFEFGADQTRFRAAN